VRDRLPEDTEAESSPDPQTREDTPLHSTPTQPANDPLAISSAVMSAIQAERNETPHRATQRANETGSEPRSSGRERRPPDRYEG